MARLSFREDIEGLRGVAILLVVLAHAGVPTMSAGFIGVDMFFVISGFLITGLLTEELRATGRVDFSKFYARRALRLAPALLLMILVVGAATATFLPHQESLPHLEAAIWALLWAANLHFAFAGIDYFGADSSTNLFLHTWSLGVEEQFYLLWPIAIVLAWRRGGRGALWLGAPVVAGFALCLIMLDWDARSTFYLMPARLWQLVLGGMTYRLLGLVDGVSGPWRGVALHSAGWLAVAAGMLVLEDGASHPGWQSLLPTLGAALLLFTGGQFGASAPWPSRWLPIRLAGRISYSWYLWHWPFLVWLPAMGVSTLSASERLFLVLASFLVAWASHAAVEQPFRRSRCLPAGRVIIAAVAASVVLAGALLAAMAWKGSTTEVESGHLRNAVNQQLGLPEIYQRNCDDWYHSADLVPCEVGRHDVDGGSIVLIADSVGAQWIPALEHAARMQKRRLFVLTKSSCPIIDLPIFNPLINRQFTECEAWREKAIAFVDATKPDIVLIGSTGYGYPRDDQIAGTARILQALTAPGRRLVAIAPTPILPFNAPRCVITTGRLGKAGLEAPECTAVLAAIDPLAEAEALAAAAALVDGASVLRMNDLVCPQAACTAVLEGQLTYRDAQHLSVGYVERLAEQFEQRLREAGIDASR